MSPESKNIQFEPDIFRAIRWNLGFGVWEIPYEDPLSPKARKKLAAILSAKLNDRLKIFFKGKKQGTFKNTVTILKYLSKDLEYPSDFPHIFKKIRLNELEEELVFYRRCGRPSNNKIKGSEKIPHQSTLINILKKLEYEEILLRTPEIESTERSNLNKKKPNVYYSINPEIFRLPIITTTSERQPNNLAKMSKEVLTINYRELQKENKVLQELFENYRQMFQKSEKDLYAAKELLKEQGVSQPDEAISLWLSSSKLWARN